MYVIVVYDMDKLRTEKARKICQRFLIHTQNSVFEGEVTEGEFKELTSRLSSLRNEGESIICFQINRADNVKRNVYGEDPTEEDIFL